MKKQKQELVYGVGVNDLNEPVYKNGKALKFYSTWVSMLQRCYSGKFQVKCPTYIGCSVCDSWLSLSNFKEWYDANYRDGMSLDKDILIPSNKVYSPEACSFVPQYINSLMTDAGAARGNLPLGITAQKPNVKARKISTTYRAYVCDGHGRSLSKTLKTVAEARQWYSITKKKVASEQANRALGSGDITEDIYQALITREW